MRISKETISQIFNTMDIVEVVSDFVSLKKSGSSYKALSPFASEKTPSFYVVPSKQIFKDFSTGKGGNAINFLMEIDKLTYVGALEYLAKKYSIEIKYESNLTEEDVQAHNEIESLYIIMEYATEFYQRMLVTHEEGISIASSYFKERGLSAKTIEDFRLGFAPDSWSLLLEELKRKQFSEDIIKKSGLVKVSENGKEFDFFRNRVMFPIQNSSGKVIALAGRIMTNDKGVAKYINSPETELYHKSKVLYGLYQARQEIGKEDVCMLVEGYMDVISLHQAGIKNVVASSGTSLTEEQVKLVSRYTKNVLVLYDGDAAGIRAAMRGTDMLLSTGLKIKVVVFPDKEDPDSYVRKIGAEAFRTYIKAQAKDFITFKTQTLLHEASDDPIQKAQVIHEIVRTIVLVKDPIERTLYLTRCSQLLKIEEQVLISEYNKLVLAQCKEDPKNPRPLPKSEGTPPTQSESDESGVYSELQTPTHIQSSVVAEREIVRMLIEYASVEIDENSKLYEILLTYIQNIDFEHLHYGKIVQIFKEELAKGQVLSLEYFVHHPQPELEQVIQELIMEKHELSPNWSDKMNVFIPLKDQDKITLIEKGVSRLNFEKLIHQYKINLLQLQEMDPAQAELVDEVLQTQVALKQLMQPYAQALGLVVIG